MTASAADADAVARLAGRHVLVVGDLVLDEYLTARPARVSREAPVLVLEEIEREYRAGSAGSPAANVVSLGSRATIVGAIGDDLAADRLEAGLGALGVGCGGLVRVPGGQTAIKTRILAEGFTGGLYGRQQVLRVDRLAAISDAACQACTERVARLAPAVEAVLLSDYRGGVVDDATIDAALAAGRFVAVDSQGDLRRFRGADLVKVNQTEARIALGSDDVLAGGPALRRELDVGCLVVTLGADGMAVFAEGETRHLPGVHVSEVFDVTGAGDTVVAVLTLGLVGGLRPFEAARLANAAASQVIRRLGVATVSPAELLEALDPA